MVQYFLNDAGTAATGFNASRSYPLRCPSIRPNRTIQSVHYYYCQQDSTILSAPPCDGTVDFCSASRLRQGLPVVAMKDPIVSVTDDLYAY